MALKCRKCGGNHLTIKCGKDKKKTQQQARKQPACCVRITNLPLDLTIKELSNLMIEWGDIGKINFNKHNTEQSAFINFYIKDEAEYFVKAMDRTIFDNDIINVEILH